MPNEITRHPRLSSDAVRLLTWQLSLPESADQPLSETASRAGIKKTGFMRAKRQLTAEGYFHEWRLQGAAGRWSTTQLISNVPLSEEDAVAVRDGRPTGGIPAVGGPGGRSVGHPQKNTKKNNPNPPSPAVDVAAPAPDERPGQGREGDQPSPAPAPASTATAPSTVPAPLVERGGQALAAVSHSEPRLRLSGQDVRVLAPLAGDWLQRGATVTDIREALTQWLPDQVHSPAGLVRDRLTRKRPAAPTFAEQRAADRRAAEAQSRPRVADMRECGGDHNQPRLFLPVDGESLCPSCRCDGAEASVAGAVEAALRGGAAIRGLLRARTAGVTA
ncbi:hypothetical protein [Streptomyces sp. NPDC020667]|uniref:hypothetical protein n=1 Tax=Streptomyces sp. NPDC020667 TaxID=3154895 RepID=UPI0033CEA080